MSKASLLNESSTAGKKDSNRKYKCPYCNFRDTRLKLVEHIDEEHEDMLSPEYTSARIVFNLINRKEEGHCLTCRKVTNWNEDVWRYDKFCSKKCKEEAGKKAKANMVNAYGKEHLLGDPEFQNKMLKGRSISGVYTFQDGGKLDYVGSYERKLLEFLDKVMGYKSTDVMSPGPTIQYEYNGEKHFWITDQYLVPYNLAFDCKDGGNNPNNREMPEYRAKQEAKEKAITEQGVYNYIRLTNNDFAQLMTTLAELKYQMLEDGPNYKKVSRIYENTLNKSIFGKITEDVSPVKNKTYKTLEQYCECVIGVMKNNEKPNFIVPILMNNTFSMAFGVTDDPTLEHVLFSDEQGNVHVRGHKFLDECANYAVFEYKGKMFNKAPDFRPRNIAEAAIGKRILSADQLLQDPDCTRICTPHEECSMMQEIIESTLRGDHDYRIGFLSESTCDYDNIFAYQDGKGFFFENTNSHYRTKSYPSLEDVPKEIISYLQKL